MFDAFSLRRSSSRAAASGPLVFLTTVGAACTVVGAVKLTRFVHRFYILPLYHSCFKRRYSQYSNYLAHRYGGNNATHTAIVTGATSGIGRACAVELARQGFHVVLLARTASKLYSLASMLQESYHVEATPIVIDASTAEWHDVETLIVKPLMDPHKNRCVSILINALGIHNQRPCNVEEMDWDLADRILTVNCRFPLLLTSQVIPLLKRHNQKNTNSHHHAAAAILNWGSLTSSTPMAMLSTYAATKSWMLHWSRCLAAELRPFGVDVVCAQPGLTATPMSGHDQAGGIVADASTVAVNALRMLGRGTAEKRIIPTPLHAVFVFLMENVLPEGLQDGMNRKAGMEEQSKMDSA